MHFDIPTIFLWLYVFNHGVAFGAGLYEHRIVVPLWMGKTSAHGIYLDSQAMRTLDTGRRFWGLVTTVPLSLITLINLGFAWHSQGSAHPWWLASTIITLIERVSTFAYFIPTAIRFMHVSEPLSESVKIMVIRWGLFNHIRLALSFLGWLSAIVALTLVR